MHSPPVNKSGSNLPDLKKRDTETGLDYFGARYYEPALGKWVAVDPLADKYLDMSPYNYCLLNPINLLDPDGKDVVAQLDGVNIGGKKNPKAVHALINALAFYLRTNTGKNNIETLDNIHNLAFVITVGEMNLDHSLDDGDVDC